MVCVIIAQGCQHSCINKSNSSIMVRKMVSSPTLNYLTSFDLKYREDCNFLGITDTMTLYVEEIYTEDSWIAQHAVTLDGTFQESIDEDYGKNTQLSPLAEDAIVARPQTGWHCMSLNFSGARHRGMRVNERIADTVQPLSIHAKMKIIDKLGLDIAPAMLLGVAESYVISEAELTRPNLYLLCRRFRLAYALPKEQVDVDNNPYDYDTLVIYVAHTYDRDLGIEPALEDMLDGMPGKKLNRPMDCLHYNDHLFIADGGFADRKSAIHIWKVERETIENDKQDRYSGYL